MPVQKFIEQGYLVPITHFVCSNPNLSQVKQRQGDYMTKMLSDVMMDNSVMSDLVESYKDKCLGKSTIIFAVDVEHSKQIVERFKHAGISSAHVDAKTAKQEREQILSDFRNGIIKVVSNVEIITEGFDFPECEVVQLARPTKSLSLYLQMVGRVMRPAKGKKEGIVLDNAGLWLEHGLSIIDRDWSLEGTKRQRKNGSLPIREIAIDEDGKIREVNRTRPSEVKGLKLIPLTFELKRLLTFESYLSNAKTRNHNLLSSYFQYKKELEDINKKITRFEFEYMRKRLNYFNEKAEPDKRFKSGFWFIQEKELNLKN
jgi:superfamily II DNA or RNA helicase